MELDELKSLWQKQIPLGKTHSEQDIRAILKQKTHPILKRIYNSFFIEMVVSSIIIVAVIVAYIYLKQYVFATVFALFTGVISLLYWLLYKKININFTRDTLHSALSKMEQLFGWYNKIMLIIRYLLAGGYFVGFIVGNTLKNKPLSLDVRFWTGLLIVIPFTLLLSYPMKWYIDWIYGRHIQELKAVYVELNELEREA